MNMIICGAGAVGSHAAEVLAAAGNNVTVIDREPARLSELEETMDVATFCGNAADANVLREAGAAHADLLIAATNVDEINLLSASVAKGLGVERTIARIHHSAYFHSSTFDYQKHFRIDRLICPEFSTALAIARALRNPGAMAIEDFARGGIEMQEVRAGGKASAIGRRLQDVNMPDGTRIAMIRRKGEVIIPQATSVVVEGDEVLIVGNANAFEDARKRFQSEKRGRRRIVLMGGPPMAVWLCRALRDRDLSIRLFERDRERAEELAEKLDWITVLHGDPTDRAVFEEEKLAQADVFIGLLDDDEANIIGCVLAKSKGVLEAISVIQKSNYMDLLYHIGVDRPYSPRVEAVNEIQAMLDERPIRLLETLAEGEIDVYRVRIDADAPVVGAALREIKLSPDWIITAVKHEQRVFVPGADDVLQVGDTALIIGRHGQEKTLRNLFLSK